MLTNLYLRILALRESEEGQTLSEYALIIAVVAVLIVGALALFRGDLAGALDDIGNVINP